MGRPVGSTPPNRKDPWQRILDNSIVQPDGCRVWTGSSTKQGYGRMSVYVRGANRHNRRLVLAHRMSYAITHGINVFDVPGVLDHLCQNKSCVEPTHLESVTPSINVNRALRAKGVAPYVRPTKGRI